MIDPTDAPEGDYAKPMKCSANSCDGCKYFVDDKEWTNCSCPAVHPCSAEFRPDKQDAIFKTIGEE